MPPAPPPGPPVWVVLRAASLRWCALQLPSPVVLLLGVDGAVDRSGRQIAFLDAGEGVVRVVAAADAVAGRAGSAGSPRVLGVSTPTRKFLFTLPRRVQRHLGILTFPRIGGRARGTDDLVAWVAPLAHGATAPDRVYLVRSRFADLVEIREPLGEADERASADPSPDTGASPGRPVPTGAPGRRRDALRARGPRRSSEQV